MVGEGCRMNQTKHGTKAQYVQRKGQVEVRIEPKPLMDLLYTAQRPERTGFERRGDGVLTATGAGCSHCNYSYVRSAAELRCAV